MRRPRSRKKDLIGAKRRKDTTLRHASAPPVRPKRWRTGSIGASGSTVTAPHPDLGRWRDSTTRTPRKHECARDAAVNSGCHRTSQMGKAESHHRAWCPICQSPIVGQCGTSYPMTCATPALSPSTCCRRQQGAPCAGLGTGRPAGRPETLRRVAPGPPAHRARPRLRRRRPRPGPRIKEDCEITGVIWS